MSQLAKWDETIDGLAPGWSSDYKRSFLPDNILVPLPGQIWQALRDCKVGFRASLSNAPLRFGDARLRKGEKVRVLLVDDRCGSRIMTQFLREHLKKDGIEVTGDAFDTLCQDFFGSHHFYTRSDEFKRKKR